METKVKYKDIPGLVFVITGNNLLDANYINENRYGLLYEPVPAIVQDRLNRLQKKLISEYQQFTAAHIKLLKDFGAVEDTATNQVSFPEGIQVPQDFYTQFEDLSNQEITIYFDSIDFEKIAEKTTIDPITKLTKVYDYEVLEAFLINYKTPTTSK